MATELLFPPNSLQQGFPALLKQMNQPCRYTYEIEGTEARLQWLQNLGRGSMRFAYLRPGLQVSVEDHQMREDLILQGQQSQSDPIKLYFLISGELSGFIGQPASPFTLDAGQNCLAACGGDCTQVTYRAHQDYVAVTILIDAWFFRRFLEGKSAIPQALTQLIEARSAVPFFHTGSNLPTMRIALHQMLHCPYDGITKQIYVESKALELIALKLAQMSEEMRSQQQTPALKPRDIECIHNAKEILLRNIEYPPSLLELAKQAGTNDYKLKIGFRQVFGTTVFGYLRNQRMEQARQLLLETQMNVSEVARTVGYASLSRFSTAFKEQFGITPKTYQKNA